MEREMLINARDVFAIQIEGSCLFVGRDALTGKEIYRERFFNTVFDPWISEMLKDFIKKTNGAIVKALAFSRDTMEYTPGDTPPSAITNEFRALTRSYNSGLVMQINGNLAPEEGNGAGNIKTVGFYYGANTTSDPGTGTLGSIITTVNVEKTSSIELSFNYELAFSRKPVV